jgi:tRNA threonylcarbamoyladenosine biosynthesis protein TsaB
MSETPLVLALDTSHAKGSVAVTRGEDVLCEVLFDASDTHSATLLPSIDVCFRTAKVRLADIDRIAVVSGPGSFTGLRIGLATAKAFAAVHRASVVPVVSLEVLAAAFPFVGRPIVTLIDARRGEVYAACYRTEGGLPENLLPVCAAAPERLAHSLAAAGIDAPAIVCGTGALRYRAVLESIMPHGSRFAGPRWAQPSASLAAVIALDRTPVSEEELFTLEPLYIRPPDARLPADARLRERGGT